jgi:hypothetical protein
MFRILSLDGGGIKGAFTASVLTISLPVPVSSPCLPALLATARRL